MCLKWRPFQTGSYKREVLTGLSNSMKRTTKRIYLNSITWGLPGETARSGSLTGGLRGKWQNGAIVLRCQIRLSAKLVQVQASRFLLRWFFLSTLWCTVGPKPGSSPVPWFALALGSQCFQNPWTFSCVWRFLWYGRALGMEQSCRAAKSNPTKVEASEERKISLKYG